MTLALVLSYYKKGIKASIILYVISLISSTNIKITILLLRKETLALLLALQHFDVYLGTTVAPVEVFTDHNPLVFIEKMKDKNQRLLRWSLAFQEYNLRIRHIKGRDNIMADALSRAII